MGTMKPSLMTWLGSMAQKVKDACQARPSYAAVAAGFAEALFTKGHSTADAELGISPLAIAVHNAVAGVLIHEIKYSTVARFIVNDGLGYEGLDQYGFGKDIIQADGNCKLDFMMPVETVEELVAKWQQQEQQKERAAEALVLKRKILATETEMQTLEADWDAAAADAKALREQAARQAEDEAANAVATQAAAAAAAQAALAAAELEGLAILRSDRMRTLLFTVLKWSEQKHLAAALQKKQLVLESQNEALAELGGDVDTIMDSPPAEIKVGNLDLVADGDIDMQTAADPGPAVEEKDAASHVDDFDTVSSLQDLLKAHFDLGPEFAAPVGRLLGQLRNQNTDIQNRFRAIDVKELDPWLKKLPKVFCHHLLHNDLISVSQARSVDHRPTVSRKVPRFPGGKAPCKQSNDSGTHEV